MARAEHLTREQLEAIAAGMAGFLPGVADALQPEVPLELREAFKVFDLSLDAIRDTTDKPFAERTTWSRRWHVQIFQGENPVGYVLVGGNDAPTEVLGVFVSSLAQAVDTAAQRIDAEAPEEDDGWQVGLVVAPSHHTHLLWIQRHDHRLVALDDDVERTLAFSGEEILDRLRSTPPIVGLGTGE
jgi:hypothetical protein